jgi:TonB family protein
MSGINIWRFARFVVMGALCVVPLAGAAKARARNEGETATEELRSLMTAALTAARDGEQSKLKEIAHGLMIPNYEAWFKATFGEEQGTKMATAYRTDFSKQENWIPTLFESLSKQDGEIVVEDVREPRYTGSGAWCGRALLRAAKNDAAFYSVGLQQTLQTGLTRLDAAGYFTLVEGSYRRLDCKALGLGPDTLTPPLPHPMSLRVGGNVQAKRIINRVQPVYPEKARKDRITGTVRLHVILAKDGTMKQVELVSGHPLLAQAALDAVRQWTYQPTLLNGEPVEVDTTIDIIFSLNTPQATNP